MIRLSSFLPPSVCRIRFSKTTRIDPQQDLHLQTIHFNSNFFVVGNSLHLFILSLLRQWWSLFPGANIHELNDPHILIDKEEICNQEAFDLLSLNESYLSRHLVSYVPELVVLLAGGYCDRRCGCIGKFYVGAEIYNTNTIQEGKHFCHRRTRFFIDRHSELGFHGYS